MNASASLYDSFISKESRARKQQQLVHKYTCPVITIKAHLPKELRNREYVRTVINSAMAGVKQCLADHGLMCIGSDEHKGITGPEFYLAVPCRSSTELKKYMMVIEDQHPLGQLMDLNVMNSEGKTISRGSSQLSARKCIICDYAAPQCARKHQHTLTELDERAKQIVEEFVVPG